MRYNVIIDIDLDAEDLEDLSKELEQLQINPIYVTSVKVIKPVN